MVCPPGWGRPRVAGRDVEMRLLLFCLRGINLSSPNARLTISDRDARNWAVAQGGVESDVRAFRRAALYADE